jgi:ATP-dependent Clp protease ATP-binding subunit ClpB
LQQNIILEATPEAIDFLSNISFDSEFGARPVKRTIQREVLNALSKDILANNLKHDQVIILDNFDNKLVFRNL